MGRNNLCYLASFSLAKKRDISRGGCRVAEAKSNSFRARLSMSGPPKLGMAVRGGVVLLVFLLKSEGHGNLNK